MINSSFFEVVNIYIDECGEITQDYFSNKNFGMHVSSLSAFPLELKNNVTIVVTDKLEILNKINAADFNLLIIVIPNEVNVIEHFQLSSAIIYRCIKDECYQTALEKIWASIIDFTFDCNFLLDAADLKLALSFNNGRYLNVVQSVADIASLEEVDLSDLGNTTSVVMNMKVNSSIFENIEKVSRVLSKKLGGDHQGDYFFSAKKDGISPIEEVFVLYSI